jgi:hypothetical protein
MLPQSPWSAHRRPLTSTRPLARTMRQGRAYRFLTKPWEPLRTLPQPRCPKRPPHNFAARVPRRWYSVDKVVVVCLLKILFATIVRSTAFYLFTSDPPRLCTGAMLILKCFSTIAYSLPREMGYLTLKEFFKSDQ